MEAKKPGKGDQASSKTASAETLTTITDDCNDVLAFLQAVSAKPPQALASPLSLCADKRTSVWIQQWTDVNLPKPPIPDLQDHLGLTGVLTDVATQLHTAEALRPVVSSQSEAEKDTKGWDRLPPEALRVILAASTTTGT